MRPNRRFHLVVASTFVALALILPSPVLAEFDEAGYELEDLSASCLRDAELSIGLRGISIGLWDIAQIGTKFLLDIAGAPNAELKFTLFDTEDFAIGVSAGVLSFDSSSLGLSSDFSTLTVPISLRASGRLHSDLRVHGAVEVLVSDTNGEAPDIAKRLARHYFRPGELSLSLAGEYRFGPHVALVLELEVPLFLPPAALRYDDEKAGLEFFRASTGVHLTFAPLNLRLGVGYGPSLFGRSGIFPAFDIAFRIP